MHGLHQPIAADEERGRPGIPVTGLRQLLLAVLVSPPNRTVYRSHIPDERLQARRIGKLLGFFEIQSDDLQPPIAILLVDRREELILVMAVRAPTARDVYQEDLAAEALVRIGTILPFKSKKLKLNGLAGSLTAVCWLASVGSGRPLARACSGRNGRDHTLVVLAFQVDGEWSRRFGERSPAAPDARRRSG